jgi:mono/diheme cytochrome c family protein
MDGMNPRGPLNPRHGFTGRGRAIVALSLAAVCASAVAFALGGDGARPQDQQPTARAGEAAVEPVTGASWLKRRGLRLQQTTLGRAGAHYGPPTDQPAPAETVRLDEPAVLTGADLYRLNCQACHRAEGTGAPPEIRSVLAAVQGASLEAVRRQLQGETGVPASETEVLEKAARAEADLIRLIRTGGVLMPPLTHLREADIDVLLGYIKELSDVQAADPRPQPIQTSWNRVGEHLVKGTCHICHDAAGARPTPRMLLDGAIPPLATFTAGRSVHEVVRKVRSGAPVMMGEPPMQRRGRMPVFDYLRNEEVAAAYNYLVAYPPQRTADRMR